MRNILVSLLSSCQVVIRLDDGSSPLVEAHGVVGEELGRAPPVRHGRFSEEPHRPVAIRIPLKIHRVFLSLDHEYE